MRLSSPGSVLATVTRGNAVESIHCGQMVVADVNGRVRWRTEALDERPMFYRSAMKPLQVLPLVEGGGADAYRLSAKELALACASHSGEPAHVRVAKRMLAKDRALSVKCLKCGTHIPYSTEVAAKLARQGRKPPVLCHNCSGKHIAQLLTCCQEGWPIATYLEPSHPLQRRIKSIVAEFADLPVSAVVSGKDGCNLPAHAVSLRRMAMTYARLATPAYWDAQGQAVRAAAVRRITTAMAENSFYVSGTGRSDDCLMSAANARGLRLFSKIGAEAVWCMGFPRERLGLALKVADGANRAQVAILAEALRQTKLLPATAIRAFEESHPWQIKSGDGTEVGKCRPAFRLHRGS